MKLEFGRLPHPCFPRIYSVFFHFDSVPYVASALYELVSVVFVAQKMRKSVFFKFVLSLLSQWLHLLGCTSRLLSCASTIFVTQKARQPLAPQSVTWMAPAPLRLFKPADCTTLVFCLLHSQLHNVTDMTDISV